MEFHYFAISPAERSMRHWMSIWDAASGRPAPWKATIRIHGQQGGFGNHQLFFGVLHWTVKNENTNCFNWLSIRLLTLMPNRLEHRKSRFSRHSRLGLPEYMPEFIGTCSASTCWDPNHFLPELWPVISQWVGKYLSSGVAPPTRPTNRSWWGRKLEMVCWST